MSRLVDMHLHTDASDGSLSVDSLMTLAANRNLRTIAITDHDTTASITRAVELGNELGVEVIAGVELSVQDEQHSIHLLGYWIDQDNPALQERLEERKGLRERRLRAMVSKLESHGLSGLDAEAVIARAQGRVGRSHLATAMVGQGLVASREEAFRHHIGDDCYGYVPYDKFSLEEATRLIMDAGGLPVLAHPYRADHDRNRLTQWAWKGLMGLEVHHPRVQESGRTGFLLKLARVLGLAVTGGSDFHYLSDKPGGSNLPGKFGISEEDLGLLKKRRDQVRLSGTEEALRLHRERLEKAPPLQ